MGNSVNETQKDTSLCGTFFSTYFASKSVTRLLRYSNCSLSVNMAAVCHLVAGAHFGTTHKKYLEVFMTFQSFLGIASVVSITSFNILHVGLENAHTEVSENCSVVAFFLPPILEAVSTVRPKSKSFHENTSYNVPSKSVKRLLTYNDFSFFSRWPLFAILDLLGTFWDRPRRVFGGLHQFAKCGWNPFSSFENTTA